MAKIVKCSIISSSDEVIARINAQFKGVRSLTGQGSTDLQGGIPNIFGLEEAFIMGAGGSKSEGLKQHHRHCFNTLKNNQKSIFSPEDTEAPACAR